jgi:glutamyl-Q tRNA(Asp) synthetase
MTATYRGRFAPTPSGPLHMGSLLTAFASWLDARRARGRWLLRIDDLDRPRCSAAAETEILRQLEAHGLTWDETPRRQSQHVSEYQAALAQLRKQGRIYVCRCTRARLALTGRDGPDGPVYAGTCREAGLGGNGALRLRLPAGSTGFEDRIQGAVRRDNAGQIGDFVVYRSDGICGYHLACSVDEHAQGITHVVRGADLIGSTLCQLQVSDALGYDAPVYAHLPVVVDCSGRKLSKQNHARPVERQQAGANLLECLELLGQAPPPALARAGSEEILAWAQSHWTIDAVPRKTSVASEFAAEPRLRPAAS